MGRLPPNPNVAIVGATGAVGLEMISILEQRGFPLASLRLLASARSAGTALRFAGRDITVEDLDRADPTGLDLALYSAGSGITKSHAPRFVEAGAVVVDNSSAFRMTDGVPLVVPEVNPDAALAHKGLIANPNCSTIIMLLAASPLRAEFGLERVHACTYQAASGAGAAAMRELLEQSRAVLDGHEPEPKIFSEPCAFNVFSHDSAVDPSTGRNLEEQKMIDETRKIWDDPAARVNATCVRVPVARAHTEALNLTLGRAATVESVRRVLHGAPGVAVLDDREGNDFPTPRKASGMDDALVGRIRPDPTDSDSSPDGTHRVFDVLIAADQLRKGAALNAVQIAELLLP